MNLKIKRRFFECVTVFGDVIDLRILWIVFIWIISEVIFVNEIFMLILSTNHNLLTFFIDCILPLYCRLIAQIRSVIDN